MIKKQNAKIFVLSALSTAILAACNGSSISEKRVEEDSTWAISGVTHLSQLSLGQGAEIIVPDGYDLTMTVNGVETPVAAGSYSGDVVLTPAKSIVYQYNGMGVKQDYHYRTAVYVKDGHYIPEKSVAAAVVGGEVTDRAASSLSISSVGDEFMGILVDGDSQYHIESPVISMKGNGVNDFNGFGASIRVAGTSKVTIDNAKISNEGVVRTAIWFGDQTEGTVNNAQIEVKNGTLPEDYGWSWVNGGSNGSGDVMREVPWMLGIVGNNRATMAAGSAKVHYNNSSIKAQAWGAMSTDAVTAVELYITDTHVELVESGYGAYADGNSVVYYQGATIDVPDYGLISAGGSAVITDGSVVNSGRFGYMCHGGSRGYLTIDKGSVINSKKAAIQLKQSSPDILVDNAGLNSESGVILQVMAHDDPNKTKSGGGGRGGPGGPGSPGAAPESMPGGPGAGGPPGNAVQGMLNTASGTLSPPHDDDDVDATFRNVTLTGDFLNSIPEISDMKLTFENAQINGAISTATADHAVGPNGEKLVMQESGELYYLIGEITETLAPASGKGAMVSLDKDSNWTVTKTSYLTGLTLAEGASIAAADGYRLTMTVDGKAQAIKPGQYEGAIELKLTSL